MRSQAKVQAEAQKKSPSHSQPKNKSLLHKSKPKISTKAKQKPAKQHKSISIQSPSLLPSPLINHLPLLNPTLFQFNNRTVPYSATSFRSTNTLFAVGGGRSKGTAPAKRFETPEKGPKKELTPDQKDKKKLEKLEREKAKQQTKQAQISRSTERGKKELELQAKKQAALQSIFHAAHLKQQAVDDKEKAELEANAKRNAMEEEQEKAARALRRANGQDTADV